MKKPGETNSPSCGISSNRTRRKLDVMQRELGVLNVQYYTDPDQGHAAAAEPRATSKETSEIDNKKKDVEADQQAIDDAEDDLRKAGGDPGWAR